MKRSNGAAIAGTLAAIGIAVLIYGALIGSEAMIAAGLTTGFVCLLLVPAFRLRASKVDKMIERKDALLSWEYAPDEIEEIAQDQLRETRKKSVSLAILLSVCLIVIFLPFVVMSAEENSGLPPMLPIILAPIALLPWIAVPIAPAAAARKIRSRPCISLVGRDHILVANRYLGVNDRYALTAVQTDYKHSGGSRMAMLRVLYQFKAMRTMRVFSLWVEVPVPHEKEKEAAEFILGKH